MTRWRPARLFSARCFLALFSAVIFVLTAGRSNAASTVLYSTAFESNEGYVSSGPTLFGQNGWLRAGSGGNGLINGAFFGQGRQAYIGFSKPNSGDASLFVWTPINASVSRAHFSVSMEIVNSTDGIYNDFFWALFNQERDPLVLLRFDNSNFKISYSVDGGANYTDTQVTFAPSTIYPLVMDFNFASNRWDATLNGMLLATNIPISVAGAPLDLGDIDAAWDFGLNAGNNYMIFDNYKITADDVPFAFTEPSTSITSWGAALNGMATPNGQPSTAWFEWGTNFGFQQATPPISVGSGSNVVWVSTNLTGLFGGQVYQDRLVVSNASGVIRGAARQFILGGHVFAWAGTLSSDTNLPGGLDNATAIAAGGGNSLALKTDGTVVQWGLIANQAAAGLSNIVGIAAGSAHYLALKNDGKVLAWGDNSFPASFGQTNVPADLSNVVAVAAGIYQSLALKKDGTVVGWGGNNVTPIPANLSNVVMIANGNGYHSEAIKNDGTIVSWGNGGASMTNPPSGLFDVVDAATGVYASTALKSSGSVVVWGSDGGGDNQTNVPGGLSNILAVAGGYYHSLALNSNGRLVGWGRNDVGQISIPSGRTNTVAVAAGGSHDVVITPPLSPPPLNDNFLNAFLITGTSATVTGSNVGATREPNEPLHDGFAGNSSVWWKWNASADGVVSISAAASTFPAAVAIYTGTDVTNLISQGSGLSSITSVRVTSNMLYYIAVDTAGSSPGNISLSLTELVPPANDQCSGAIPMTSGVTYTLNTVAATSTGDQTPLCTGSAANGVWYQFTSPTDAYVNLSTCGSDFDTVLAVFTGSCGSLMEIPGGCDDDNGPSCSGTRASVVFNASGGVPYWILAGGYSGARGNLSIVASAHPLLVIQCPADISVPTANDAPPADPNSVQILSPGCGGVVRSLFSQSASQTQIHRVYEVSDSCGQIQYCDQFINLTCRPPQINGVSYVGQNVQADGIHVMFQGNVSGDVSSFTWQVTGGTWLSSNNPQDGSFDVVVSPTNTSIIQVSLVSVSGPCGNDGNSQSGTGGATCSFCLTRGSPSLLTGGIGSSAVPQFIFSNGCGTLSTNTRWSTLIPSDTGFITVSTEGSPNVKQIAVYGGASLASLTNVTCVSSPQNRLTFYAISGGSYWLAVDPGTNSVANLHVASGFEPTIQNYRLSNGTFELLSTVAPPVTYRLLATTNLSLPVSNWPVIFTTNWNTNYPYTNYRVDFLDTNLDKIPRRFYRLAPGP